MAISDDWTIDYTDLTITHTSGTTVYDMYEMYSWLMDEVDESGTIDDTVPMTAQTPTAYTLTNGWFIDETSIQYLTGGSLKTNGWANGQIVIISYNASTTPFSSSDIGQTITGGTTGDTGTVLAYEDRYGTDLGVVWIRPDDPAADLFDNATEDFLVTGPYADGVFTSTLDSGGGITGENIWANIYTLGAIVDYTQIYLIQDESTITSWWTDGHIDILLKVQEGDNLINEGYATIFARQYSKLYAHFISDLSSGIRTPIPLSTLNDTNNDSGIRQMVLTTASGDFTEGEVIQDTSDTTIEGIVTSNSGTAPNITLEYYVISNDLVDFDGTTGAFSGLTSTTTATAVAPTDVGPANLTTPPTFSAFGTRTEDLNNGNGSQPYDVAIDCNQHPLTDVYEWLKYQTRRGNTTDLDSGSLTLPGEHYTAVGEQYISYTIGSGTLTEGNTVTGDTSGATATIVSNHTGEPAIVVTGIVGEFNPTEGLTEGANTGTATAIEDISPFNQSPFGTFAGGKFFGARGVWITDYAAADGNSFQLIDSTDTHQIPPTTVPITITNTASGDRVSVFKTTGLDSEVIDKNQYNIDTTQPASPASEIRIEESIPDDTPAAGWIRIVERDASGKIQKDQRIDYTSWNNTGQPAYSTFSLTGNTYGNTQFNYDDTDTAYVPYIDEQASGTTVSDTFVYVSDRNILVRVRIVGMLPFKQVEILDNDGFSIRTVRTTDSIYQ